jgi:hypothetical protein
MMINMMDYLESKSKYIDKSKLVVVEQQLKQNPKAQRIEHNCEDYFIFTYRDTKTVIPFPSKHKTKVLGMPKYPKKLKAYQKKKLRKEWSCMKALEILKLRGDTKTELQILKSKKQDDFADTITQLQAFKIKCFIDKRGF